MNPRGIALLAGAVALLALAGCGAQAAPPSNAATRPASTAAAPASIPTPAPSASIPPTSPNPVSASPSAPATPTADPPASTAPPASSNPPPAPTPVGSPLVVSGGQLVNPALKPVPVAGHSISLPPGFSISVFASGLRAPRFMAFDSAGNLAVAEDGANRVILFHQQNGALASQPSVLIGGLSDPSSVAFFQDFIYVAEAGQVSRYPYQPGGVGPRQVIVPNLPPATDHHTRTVVFGPDGSLYLALGSPCNACRSADPRYAAISRYNADGTGFSTFAKGLRNAVGLAFQPGTGQLWATVNGRDGLGDNIPWDLITSIRQGADYGFPSCYDDRQPDPQFGTAGGCGSVTLPDAGIQAHSAPLGLAFYTGNQFPAEYKGDLLVALHGSWNRSVPTGYDLVRAHFSGGRIVAVSDFATGWAPSAAGRVIQTPFGLGTSGAWGRPVQPVVAPDGSVYVSDDYLGAIYRITYGS